MRTLPWRDLYITPGKNRCISAPKFFAGSESHAHSQHNIYKAIVVLRLLRAPFAPNKNKNTDASLQLSGQLYANWNAHKTVTRRLLERAKSVNIDKHSDSLSNILGAILGLPIAFAEAGSAVRSGWQTTAFCPVTSHH